MSEALLWVVGGGGLLGSHLRRALRQRLPDAALWDSEPLHLAWHDPTRLAGELNCAVAAFAAAVRERGGNWALAWCAGTGVVTSPTAVFEPEWSAWVRLLDLLGRHLCGRSQNGQGAIFLASSAGGAFGGSPDRVLTEHTPPQPVSDYGVNKLRMEEALRNWAAAFPDVSYLIGRISSLYGPGQDLRKAQGIISHLSRCSIHRRPVNIYVPLDTLRDYLFADDCAHQVAASLRRLLAERPRGILKIFASEELTSLSRIVGVFFRITKHRPLIVLQRSRRAQPVSLKLRSEVWRDLPGLRKTDLATGIHRVHEHHLALFRCGLLPWPA